MAPNPLDHSYVLDINLTVHAELADKFFEAVRLGGYKNKRLTQLQVLLANLISNNQIDPDLYTSVSLADGFYKPHSRYNSQFFQTLITSHRPWITEKVFCSRPKYFPTIFNLYRRQSRSKQPHSLFYKLFKLIFFGLAQTMKVFSSFDY